MEIIPVTRFDVTLESNCRDYEGIRLLLKEVKDLFNVIPRDDEERILFDLCNKDYSWDSTYVYKDSIKICKINHISQQVILNPDIEVDKGILEICKGHRFYRKGVEM